MPQQRACQQALPTRLRNDWQQEDGSSYRLRSSALLDTLHQLLPILLAKWCCWPGPDFSPAPGARMSGGANPLQVQADSTFPYAVSLLCLIFLAILLAWDVAVGTLSFILGSWSHLKEVLIGRLKEELLALGVVSLIVAFMEPTLGKACLPTPGGSSHAPSAEAAGATPEGPPELAVSPTEPVVHKALRMLLSGSAAGEGDSCPEGKSQLFPANVVATSHYLLFWVAIVQIGYTLLSALFSGIRHLRMNHWEQAARNNLVDFEGSKYERNSSLSISRDNELAMVTVEMTVGSNNKVALDMNGVEQPHGVPSHASKPKRGGCLQWLKSARNNVLRAGMTRKKYCLLRHLLLLRVQCDPHAHELRTMNLVVASEQLTQHETSYVHAHTWLQILAVTLITLYGDRVSQVVWAGPFVLVALALLIWKLHNIASRAATLINEHAPDLSLISISAAPDSGLGSFPFPGGRRPATASLSRYTGVDIDGKYTVDASELVNSMGQAGPGELPASASNPDLGGGLLRMQARRKHLESAADVVASKGGMLMVKGTSTAGAGAKDGPTQQLLDRPADSSSADSSPNKQQNGGTLEYKEAQGDSAAACGNAWAPPVVPGLERTMTLQQHPQLLGQVLHLEEELGKLWWFNWPRLMLWLIELVSVVICAMLTYSFYLLSNSGRTKHGQNLTVILIDIVFALLCSMYVGWVFYPQFALLYTAMAAEPHQILHHLKWKKVLDDEEHHGVAGFTAHMLEKAQHRCVYGHSSSHGHGHGSVEKHSHGNAVEAESADLHGLPSPAMKALGASRAARTKALVDAWVVSLALRAGVLMPGQQVAESQAYLMQHAPLFLSCALTWRHKAMVHQGKEQPPAGGYVIRGKSWLDVFYEVFGGLDADESGVITDQELQEHMQRSFNVQLTASELNAMMYEVAASGTSAVVDFGTQAAAAHPLDPAVPVATIAHASPSSEPPVGRQHHRRRGVNFRNFVLFAAFAFLDSHRKGYLDLPGLRSTLQLYGLKIDDWQLGAMVSHAAHNNGHQVGPVQFLHVFDDVQLLAE